MHGQNHKSSRRVPDEELGDDDDLKKSDML